MIRFSNFSTSNVTVFAGSTAISIPAGVTAEFPEVTFTGTVYTASSRIIVGTDAVTVTPETSRADLFGMGFGLGLACVATAVIFSMIKGIVGTRQIFD